MKKLKQGKEEIIYLLKKCIDKYTSQTGKEIILNTNRKNYESLALVLSEISNALPYTSKEFGHDPYMVDPNPKKLEFPYRKYDITGGQIKDALNGIVSNPRSFLVDACYIYLYNVSRKKFSENPLDNNLIESEVVTNNFFISKVSSKFYNKIVFLLLFVITILLIIDTKYYFEWKEIKKDFDLTPYNISKNQIDSIEGIWLCYTGSPQARISDPKRFHKVVPNLLDIKYKNGYFTFMRYGASFNHKGYLQFESKNIISMFSRVINISDTVESPRHTLLDLNEQSNILTGISTSWNFDVGNLNKLIGIREVFIKQGKTGYLEEITNTIENASCQCKIIKWHQPNNTIITYQLKNQILDSLKNKNLIPLIDEKSILQKNPTDSLIISR